MSGDGQLLAIKRAFKQWRVYEVLESDAYGQYTKVLRDDDGEIRTFGDEAAARGFIEATPDATETDYPA